MLMLLENNVIALSRQTDFSVKMFLEMLHGGMPLLSQFSFANIISLQLCEYHYYKTTVLVTLLYKSVY